MRDVDPPCPYDGVVVAKKKKEEEQEEEERTGHQSGFHCFRTEKKKKKKKREGDGPRAPSLRGCFTGNEEWLSALADQG